MEREEVKKRIAERFGGKVQIEQRSERRVFVYAENDIWVDLADFLFNELDARFDTGCGLDDRDGVEVMFFFPFDKEHYYVTVKTFARKPYPQLDSISNVITGAKWIEREIFEMFEVNFKNHPDLRPVLRSDTRPADFYPHKREGKDAHEMSRVKLDGWERFNEVKGKAPKGENP
ncbi:MAG: NADH-quinone oxidoreductase subunit C [Candidatus Krumholzibacteriota bacterium]|nr:NADH-quinone oxidoreductase subunit C [Candidatus Krumholzibacteriota bacterium]